MKYYFLSGRNFNLSKTELTTLLPQYIKVYTLEYIDELLITVQTTEEFDVKKLFSRLGGYISYGEIIDLEYDFTKQIKEEQKVVFGINYHSTLGRVNSDFLKRLGENIKQSIKQKGASAKFLVSDNGLLNAIQVEKERLFERGFLLEIFETNKGKHYGLALGVQDVEFFSKVEYDKPYTDKRMGVLPAKLAKMMVNFAGLKPGETLWDPFCGSGTVVLEGFSQGIHVLGSDVSNKAIEMAQANIEWYAREAQDTNTKHYLFRLDVLKPDNKILNLIRKTQIDAVVCEPFMGPPQRSVIPIPYAKRLTDGVKKLYSNLFEILEHSKLTNFRAVIVVPSYKTSKGWVTLPISEFAGKKWEVQNKKGSGYLQWSRSDSIIRRNIFVLYKKK
jgi:tRNA G10  N-methylase Trm11